MSIGVATPGALGPPGDGFPRRADVFVAEGIRVPGWVVDLETYRQWARSEDYPKSGLASFLDGAIFVDPTMEELFTHNQVKGAYAYAVMSVLGPTPSGMYVHDRMLLTNQAANLSTEPDGLFFFWTTIQSERLRMIEGADGNTELSGTPDMILEIVSKYSVRKDTIVLRELYWKAKIPEFWLVDARGTEPRFEILRRAESEYVAVEAVDGWLPSANFGRQFRLVKQTNPLGKPQFVVEHRPANG
jgi:Uma2 family endonuclease